MPKNLKDELFNRLSSLKEKMKLIEKYKEELKEIFKEKAKINGSIEYKNEEIERIECLLKTKLNDEEKKCIENDIESLEVAIKSLEERIKREIKMEEITHTLYEKYSMKDRNNILELYEFINKMYNFCLKKEVREFLGVQNENFRENSSEIKDFVVIIDELSILLYHFLNSNRSNSLKIKRINKKLFFDIFIEVNEKLIVDDLSISSFSFSEFLGKEVEENYLLLKEKLKKEIEIKIKSKKEYLEKLMKSLFDEKILLKKLREEMLKAEIEKKMELAEEIMAKKIKIKKIIKEEALVLKKLENLIITKTNSEELLEDLFKLKKIFKETERTRSPLSESVYSFEDLKREEDPKEIEKYEQMLKTIQRQPVKNEVRTYDTIQILDQELKQKKLFEESERTISPLSESVCSFRNLENEENLEKLKVNGLEEKESDLYKSLSEATEEIKDSKVSKRHTI